MSDERDEDVPMTETEVEYWRLINEITGAQREAREAFEKSPGVPPEWLDEPSAKD